MRVNPITDMSRAINPCIFIDRESNLDAIVHVHDIGRSFDLKNLPLHLPHRPIGGQDIFLNLLVSFRAFHNAKPEIRLTPIRFRGLRATTTNKGHQDKAEDTT
jgi:hypothetical protein